VDRLSVTQCIMLEGHPACKNLCTYPQGNWLMQDHQKTAVVTKVVVVVITWFR